MEKRKYRDFDKAIKFLSIINEEFAVKFDEMQSFIPEKFLENVFENDEYKYQNSKYNYCIESKKNKDFLYLSVTAGNKTYALKINENYLSLILNIFDEEGTFATLTTTENNTVNKIDFQCSNHNDINVKLNKFVRLAIINVYTANYELNQTPNWEHVDEKYFDMYGLDALLETGHIV